MHAQKSAKKPIILTKKRLPGCLWVWKVWLIPSEKQCCFLMKLYLLYCIYRGGQKYAMNIHLFFISLDATIDVQLDLTPNFVWHETSIRCRKTSPYHAVSTTVLTVSFWDLKSFLTPHHLSKTSYTWFHSSIILNHMIWCSMWFLTNYSHFTVLFEYIRLYHSYAPEIALLHVTDISQFN